MLAAHPKRIESWKILLLVTDSVMVWGALFCAAAIYSADLLEFWRTNQLAFYLTWGAFLISFYLAGLYEADSVARIRSVIAASGAAVGVGTLISVLLFYLIMSQKLGRLILLPVSLGLWAGLIIVRWAMVRLMSRGFMTQRALIVGHEREAVEAIQLIRQTPQAGFTVVGIVAEQPGFIGRSVDGSTVIGELKDIQSIVESNSAGTIIIATRRETEWAVLQRLRPMRYRGIELMDLMALHERLGHEIPLAYVDDEWLMSATMNSSRLHIAKLKRLMDVCVSSVGLALAAPICALTAILIKLDSRGPVFYRQERLGRDSVTFVLLKFRTMRQDAESDSGPVWADTNDPRITRLGRWLRGLRIDEIPQLINVLRGEMSLVGPRPERAVFVEKLTEKIPFYGERLLVQPGVTGWAQVNYPYTSSVEETVRKLQYDLYYIKHMSFSLDCLVLLRTIKIVLSARERVPLVRSSFNPPSTVTTDSTSPNDVTSKTTQSGVSKTEPLINKA